MKQLFFFLATVLTPFLHAQTVTDTTTYELLLNDGRTTLVKITEVKKDEYIKVVDEKQITYTFDWGAFKYYKPAYSKPLEKPAVKPSEKSVVRDPRFDPNYNATGYVPKIPGKKQRNAGIVLFSLGVGFLAAAIPMILTADDHYYQYTVGPNGQSTSRGDIKGALGVTMLIPGVGLTITGPILWSRGNAKLKKYKRSKMILSE